MRVVTIAEFSMITTERIVENIDDLTGLSRRRSRVRVPSLAPFSLQKFESMKMARDIALDRSPTTAVL